MAAAVLSAVPGAPAIAPKVPPSRPEMAKVRMPAVRAAAALKTHQEPNAKRERHARNLVFQVHGLRSSNACARTCDAAPSISRHRAITIVEKLMVRSPL